MEKQTLTVSGVSTSLLHYDQICYLRRNCEPLAVIVHIVRANMPNMTSFITCYTMTILI